MNLMDSMAKEQIKKIGDTHLNAKIQMLEELLEEIKENGYTTFSEINGSINNNLDIFNEMKTTREAK